jgi:predicted RNase H-like HicB family nuclease
MFAQRSWVESRGRYAAMNRYTAILTRDEEDGGWVAQCAEVPSAITQGETKREALRDLKAAVKFMLRVEAQAALKKAPKGARIEPIRVPA